MLFRSESFFANHDFLEYSDLFKEVYAYEKDFIYFKCFSKVGEIKNKTYKYNMLKLEEIDVISVGNFAEEKTEINFQNICGKDVRIFLK